MDKKKGKARAYYASGAAICRPGSRPSSPKCEPGRFSVLKIEWGSPVAACRFTWPQGTPRGAMEEKHRKNTQFYFFLGNRVWAYEVGRIYLCDEDVRACYAVEGGAGVSRVRLLIALTYYPSFALAFSRIKVILVSIEQRPNLQWLFSRCLWKLYLLLRCHLCESKSLPINLF